MKALLVIVIALALLVGVIAAAILFGPGSPTTVPAGGGSAMGNATFGKQVSMRLGCATCHTEDGVRAIGPSFQGLWGSVVTYEDGSTALVDDNEIRAALKAPNAKIIAGFEPRMPDDMDNKMSEEDRLNLLAYLRSLGVQKSKAE